MANGEGKQGPAPEVDSDLAKDVANLYSWANVEDAPAYRDFSRQRKIRHSHHSTDVDLRKADPVQVPELSIESQAKEFAAAVEPPPELEDAESAAPPPLVSIPEAPVAEEPPPTADFPETVFPADFFTPSLQPLVESIPSALAIYSLAGGVGKTTLCANLGRIFSAMKEKVLLVDASGSGLLPFYFGATDLRSGLRTFVAPDANYPPLQIIGTHEITKQWLENDVKTAMRSAQRTIFDLGPASMSLLPEVAGLCGTILIPLLPDLNSILTVSRIESSLQTMRSSGVNVPDVFYIFNRFDQEDSIDQRARALVVRQCDDRLLPNTIRDASEIAKAIASRMTVADHAPGSPVTHDFLEIASWMRKRAPVRAGTRVQARWSER
jgi:cellulose biosynthesis protein BcsQ